MDISKEYIKMCEKAEEIQKEWKPQLGDIAIKVYRKDILDDVGVVCTRDRYGNGDFFLADIFNQGEGGTSFYYPPKGYCDNCIWLPRQDQLQEIVITLPLFQGRVMLPLFEMFDWFYDFVWDTTKGTELTSIEQLWLAFVMKEKYSKVWDGKDWINV